MSDTAPAAPAVTEQTAPAAPAATVPSVNESAAPQGTLQGPEGEASGTPEAATTGEADQDVEPSKSKNKVPYRERVEQLAREKRDLAEAKRQAELEVERLRARLNASEQTQQQLQPLDPLNFNSDAEYQAAMQRELAKSVSDVVRKEFITEQQRLAEGRAAELEARAVEARDAVWNERSTSFREKAPDFEQVAYSHAHKVSPAMAELIKESEHGPEIAYWLGKNPQESEKIWQRTVIREGATVGEVIEAKQRAGIEIGRLEARFAQPAAPRFTQAPAPVKTVSSGNAAPVKAPGEMSFAEYETWRMAQMNKGK